jgi:adenosylmethionine-8-amino-7-oxononanoate aminotransferase
MHKLAQLDHQYVWHPFTQMKDWLKREPIVITEGKGAVLRDVHGREYLDANSSIWTNLHGHRHPKINAAIQKQLKKVSHTSSLGFANEPASLLAEKLVVAANPASKPSGPHLNKVFYSDDGSTAMEVALKLSYEFARRNGNKKPKFLSLAGAYHGDTIGAVSLGHIDLFHKAYSGLLFQADKTPAPACYRCPHNRARPERTDARESRKCNWECVSKLEAKCVAQKKRGNAYAGFAFEPLMQGAAGMIAQPKGWLQRVAKIVRGHGTQLIADEVMTGFGRTGGDSLFASHQEKVQPDFLAVAKGLTGGYLPMAATLTSQKVFDAFLGEYHEFKTFFHGHSFTGNQLGAAAGLASMDLLQDAKRIEQRKTLENLFQEELETLWSLKSVGDVRRVGLVAGVELVQDWETRTSFKLEERAGIRVCEAMAHRGVLTRPIGNVIVLMPPYCTSKLQMRKMFSALRESIEELFGK